jgi:hypothetical protein
MVDRTVLKCGVFASVSGERKRVEVGGEEDGVEMEASVVRLVTVMSLTASRRSWIDW